ncbi:MAG: RNA polymerase sigma factor [Proteobacteria bacterium]|nr:RNA polymerase sigma factor [Pseudomonadota bacterium]MCZ6781817.1 RNA polymerase sigma factor [Pseudomonadota bacterium]
MARLPDEVLVKQMCEGDEAAFEIVYERYFPRIYRFVEKRLNNRADTEETVQEAFINVFSSIGSFRGDAPFAAWVFGLTRRTIAARFKKKRHVTVPLTEDDPDRGPAATAAAPDPTPLEAYEVKERLAQMETTARTKLTQEQRTLFRMHHLEHRPISEIAKTLSKSEDAVKSNLYRARRILLAH